MTNIPRQQSISIPLWGKLAIVFLVIFLVPTITGAALFFTTTQTIDRENLGAFVQQNGQRQRQVLINQFLRARESLEDFATMRDTNQQLVGLLLADVQTNPSIPAARPAEIEQLLLETVLDPATTLFSDVRVLNLDGTLITSAGELSSVTVTAGQDESGSDAYREIVNETTNDPSVTQTIVVSRSEDRPIEFVQTINLRSTDNVIGYLVATMDVDQVLLPTLAFTDDVYPAYSFLLSDNGVIVTEDDFRTLAEASRDTNVVDLAFQDQTGFDFYQLIGEGEGEVGGYYTRLPETPFIMVTQVGTADVITQRQAYLSAIVFPILVGVIVLGTILALFSRHLTEPLENLQRAMQALAIGSFEAEVRAAERGDEIGDVARAFVDMRQQTQYLIEDLERRIARRTRDMETTQEISNFAITQRNLEALMDDVVELIAERFANIYHAQIFLIDNDRRFAVLRASTGPIGKELLSRGHRLAVGSISVIGQVTAQGELMVARDTTTSEVHRRNEFLPETRAELAIPLKLGDEIIGALDVQSKESATFDEEQVGVLQSMAAQLAIAIENTRLYQESVQRLRNIETQNRDETKRVWQEYMYDNRKSRLIQQSGTPTPVDFDTLRARALETNHAVVGDETNRNTVPVAVPIRLRGEVIGAIACELPVKEYDTNKLQLAEDLAERLALSLDNTRLFEQSQRATERERLVNEISAKLTAQTDVNRILQTAVREVGQALRSPQVSIRLSRQSMPEITPTDNPAIQATEHETDPNEQGNL